MWVRRHWPYRVWRIGLRRSLVTADTTLDLARHWIWQDHGEQISVTLINRDPPLSGAHCIQLRWIHCFVAIL